MHRFDHQAAALAVHQGGVTGKLEFDGDPDGLVPAALEKPHFADIGHWVSPTLTYTATYARSMRFA